MPFSANLELNANLPAILLEDFDWHFEDIVCKSTTIELQFIDSATMSIAWEQMRHHPEMLMITSHFGCNADGERKPHL